MEYRKSELEGYALCKVLINKSINIVSTYIQVPCVVYDDWQEDGGFYHNEGWIETKDDKITVCYPNEYKVILANGTTKEGNGEITKVIEILKGELNERINT